MNRLHSDFLTAIGMLVVAMSLVAHDREVSAVDTSEKLKSGEPVPFVWAIVADGCIASSRDFEKRVVLLEFWSVKDKGRAETQKSLSKLRKEFLGDKRLLIMSVCMDDEWEHWLQYCTDQDDLPLPDGGRVPFFSDAYWWHANLQMKPNESEQLAKDYKLTQTPAYFVLKPGGVLVASNPKPENWQVLIAQQLKNLPNL